MKIIKYQESYSSANLRRLTPSFVVWLSILSFLIILLFLSVFIPFLHKHWLLLSIFAVIFFTLSKNHVDTLVDQIRSFRFGKEGEDAVIEELKKTLDDNYVYVTNYQIPNTKIGDIDGLLICPKGILVLEVKNYVGVFRISGDDMLRRLRGDIYKLYRRSPFQQVIRQTKYLDKFFKDNGVNVRVLPIVVLVTGKISAISGATGVFVAEINKLTNHIFELSSIPDWSAELSNKIISALDLEGQNQDRKND
jgi:hypothetical protein